MAVTDDFTVGRVALRNGPAGTPFPSNIRQTGADRISVTGMFHPETDGVALVDRVGLGLAFQQQWLGLSDEVDAVPLVSTAQPQLSGVYRVRSTSIDWVKSITSSGGTVAYTGEFERVRPTSTAAVSEIQLMRTNRPQAAPRGVAPVGYLWTPDTVLHRTIAAVSGGVLRTTDTNVGMKAHSIALFGGATAVVFAFQVGQRLEEFYDGACIIEMKHAGSDVWHPVVGRQIPTTDAGDVRISNGVIRQTVRADGEVVLERSFESSPGVFAWSLVNEFRYSLETSEPTSPGTPSIVRNGPESVTVKYVMNNLNAQSDYLSCTLERGSLSLNWSGLVNNATLRTQSTDTIDTVTGGFESSTQNSDGFGWCAAFDSEGVLRNVSTNPSLAYLGRGIRFSDLRNRRSWMIGVTEPVPSGEPEGTGSEVVAQWYAAIAQTQRFVTP